MSITELEPLRFSRLKWFGRSPAHYLANLSDDTTSLRKGSATHTYLLGNKENVVVYEDGARNPRHKAYQAFLAENEGKLILSPSEFKDVEGMRQSLERHPRAMELLDGIRQERIYWSMSGRECSGEPDVVRFLPKRGNLTPKGIVELKTGQSAALDLFKWQARKLHYHGQVSFYKEGLERTNVYPKGPVEEVHIVAVESSPPYPVTVFRVTDRMLDRGARTWRLWFEQLLVCERANHFPAYTECDVDWDDEETELEWDEEHAA